MDASIPYRVSERGIIYLERVDTSIASWLRLETDEVIAVVMVVGSRVDAGRVWCLQDI